MVCAESLHKSEQVKHLQRSRPQKVRLVAAAYELKLCIACQRIPGRVEGG